MVKICECLKLYKIFANEADLGALKTFGGNFSAVHEKRIKITFHLTPLMKILI